MHGVAAAEHGHRAVVAGLDVAGAWRGDEDGDLTTTRDQRLDLLAQLLAGDVQRLADIGEPVRPDFRDALDDETVGVVAEYRDARVHGVRGRGGERRVV